MSGSTTAVEICVLSAAQYVGALFVSLASKDKGVSSYILEQIFAEELQWVKRGCRNIIIVQ